MASTSGNAKEITQLKTDIDGLRRKILMQDIRIAGLLKRFDIDSKDTPTDEPVVIPPVDEPGVTPSANPDFPTANPVDYKAMERDDLYALAIEKELKPHVQLGKTKLIELLQVNDAK